MSGTPRAGLALLAVLAAALSACADPAEGPAGDPASASPSASPSVDRGLLRELTDRAVAALPTSDLATEVTALDLVAGREQAGLPSDADPLGDSPSAPATPAARAVRDGATAALGELATTKELAPGAVRAAVTVVRGTDEVTVVRTEQDLGELSGLPGLAVGDGVLALASGRAVAARAVDGSPAGSPTGELVERVATEGAGVRVVDLGAVGATGPWRCLDALATADPLTGTGGALAFVPERTPDAVKPVLQEAAAGTPWAGWAFGAPEVRDGWWWTEVDLSRPGTLAPVPLLAFADRGGQGERLVRCVAG